jgi:hypothetical protein
MEIFAGIAGAVVGIAVIAAFIAGFFIWVGAKMAGVRNATMGKSILAAVSCTLFVWILAAVFSVLPVVGTAVGFIVGLIACVWIIKAIFDTSTGKALLAWIFHFAAQVIAVIIGLATFAGGLMAFLK